MDAKVVLVLCLTFCALQSSWAGKKLIVVLIDGVRWDYIEDANLKGIPRMIKNGVRAPFVYPVFPSKSYPNWYTIVTGQFAETHGFVANDMYDPKLNSFFIANDTDHTSLGPAWWNEAEPIWITAEKNASKAAMYWWAGCEIEIKGKHPMICERHRYGPGTDDEKYDFFSRIDDLVGLFNPNRSPEDTSRGLALALMYYGPVDYNGHAHGPDSPEVKKSMYSIDEVLDTMQSKLQAAGLEDEVNIMVVSDHGMTSITEEATTLVDLDKFSPDIKFQVTNGPNSMIIPADGMLDKLYSDLKQENITGVSIYKREEIPNQYHLKDNDRVSPIFIQADLGYYIKAIKDDSKRVGYPYAPTKGTHGYDPYTVEDMRTIFIATGPSFRKDFVTAEPLHNYDFYNVMCHIMDIKPLPNNGSWERIHSVLVDEEEPSLPLVSEGMTSVESFHLIAFSSLMIISSFLLKL